MQNAIAAAATDNHAMVAEDAAPTQIALMDFNPAMEYARISMHVPGVPPKGELPPAHLLSLYMPMVYVFPSQTVFLM